MDFRKRGMNFRQAELRYAELRRQRDAGSITDEEFEAQRQQLMVQDDEGRWWTKRGETGEWHYLGGGTWALGTPPGYQEATPEPTTASSPAQTPSRPDKDIEDGETRPRRMPLWIPVAGLGGVALMGIVLIVWVLVPYLRGEPASDGATSMMSSKQGATAPSGTAFDAAFIHHATSENISQNSTYLDNPLTNDNPNVVLYVTQNWNPGGGGGTYNNHPIGVWYNPDRQRWAIFNQDREAMPEGAAFNVAVLKEATEMR